MMDKALRDAALALTRKLMDEGKIIEGGWQGFQMMVVPQSASDVQRREMRRAFFAGAQHLFASIMSGLEAGDDPTPADLARMDHIHGELREFAEQLKKGLN